MVKLKDLVFVKGETRTEHEKQCAIIRKSMDNGTLSVIFDTQVEDTSIKKYTEEETQEALRDTTFIK